MGNSHRLGRREGSAVPSRARIARQAVMSATAAAFLLEVVVCLGSLTSSAGSSAQEGFFRFGFSKSLLVNGHLFIIDNTSTPGACGLACSSQIPCRSFGFQSERASCLLYDYLVGPFDNATFSPETRYFWNTTCPTEMGYTLLYEVCYKVVYDPRTWPDARDYCEMDRGRLFVGDTAEKRDVLRKLPSGFYAIGGSDAALEADWRWLNGAPVTDSWKPDQPDNYADSDCLFMGSTYLFDDGTCTTKTIFICEFPLVSPSV